MITTSSALQALGDIPPGVDYSGNGDANYWMRTASDFSAYGHALGQSLYNVSAYAPASLRPIIAAIAPQLTSMDPSGTGDATYWMQRTTALATTFSQACQQLTSLERAPDASQPMPVGPTLGALAALAASEDYSGTGDVNFWCKTARDAGMLANAIGTAVQQVAASSAEPMASYLRGLGNSFSQVNYAGTGDVNYWLAQDQNIVQQVHSLGQSLQQLSGVPSWPGPGTGTGPGFNAMRVASEPHAAEAHAAARPSEVPSGEQKAVLLPGEGPGAMDIKTQ
jgi:hypothetical protein